MSIRLQMRRQAQSKTKRNEQTQWYLVDWQYTASCEVYNCNMTYDRYGVIGLWKTQYIWDFNLPI